jgi:hypothetical protein
MWPGKIDSNNNMGSQRKIPQTARVAREITLICYNNDFVGFWGSKSLLPRNILLDRGE